MADVPRRERSTRDHGRGARDGNDPTLAGYLSSLYLIGSVPAFLIVAYGGRWAGLWGDAFVLPVFAGLLVASIVVVAVAMSDVRPWH